jgi:hypothetical protein
VHAESDKTVIADGRSLRLTLTIQETPLGEHLLMLFGIFDEFVDQRSDLLQIPHRIHLYRADTYRYKNIFFNKPQHLKTLDLPA